MSEIKVKEKKGLLPLVLLLIIFCMALIGGLSFINQQYQAVDINDNAPIDILIPESSTAREVAAILKDNNLVRSEKGFLAYCRKSGTDNKLQAGHYIFKRSFPLDKIVEKLVKGEVVKISFTIPEGYTIQQIGDLLVNENICSRAAWEEAISKDYSYDFLKLAPENAVHLEGFLFPDTYMINENTSAEQIINIMLSNFSDIWNENFAAEAKKKDRNIYDIITIAALIEREAMVDEERKTIAGVVMNRLDNGMPLQIDATVIYSLGEYREVVTYGDLECDSPYNTYKYGGLPLGPIASPGRFSIEAALNPEKHSYYYYVSKGDGSHYFSKTYAEHSRAKNKYIN